MRAILLAALAPLIWGSTYIVTTEFLPPDRPLLVALLRALPLGIIITLAYWKFPKGIWVWRIFILGALNIGLFFALLFVGAYRLPGGIAATMGALQPLFAILVAWLLIRERAPLSVIGAGVLGILGVGLLVLEPSAQLDLIGVLASIAGALSMASGIVMAKYWGPPVNLLLFTGWQLVAGGIILIPIVLFFEPGFPTFTPTNIAGMLWMIIINTGLGYWLWFTGIKRLRSSQVAFLVLISPAIAALLGYVFLAEGFAPRQWVGILLIAVAIVVAQIVQQRAKRQFKPATE
jgi:probable blue pigment (indigoidine) exporter